MATPVPQKVDDAAFTIATDRVIPIGALADDASPDSVDEGDIGIPRMSVRRVMLSEGDVAHDVTDLGNPVKIGGQARQTSPTAVADGDRVSAMFDDLGRQVVVPSPRDLLTHNTTTISASTSETTILAAVASTFLDLRCIIVSNTSASAVRIDFRDATGGTIRFSLQVPAGDTRGFMLQAVVPQTTVNNNWTAQCSASVTDVRIFIQAEKTV